MRWLARALDLIYPTRCLVCDADFSPGRSPLLCEPCADSFPVSATSCQRCAQPIGPHALNPRCANCEGRTLDFEWAEAIGRYEGSLREAVHRFKFLGLDQLARPFAERMAERANRRVADAIPWDLIVPIPCSRKQTLFPVRNPPDLLAQELSMYLRIPVRMRLLRKSRVTPPQTMLGRRERLAAPVGSMQVARRKEVEGKTVLIVDDILTTGATCSAAARALLSAGAHACHVVVIAR